MALTSKQEKFCVEVIKQPTLSDAYRIAYDVENMSDEVINKEASLLMKNRKVSVRVGELKKELEEKEIYTLSQSIRRDLKLIERYEKALDILDNVDSNEKDITAANRTIKHIGSNGYNSAQERLSKQHGFFSKDNNQKKISERVIVNMSDYKKE